MDVEHLSPATLRRLPVLALPGTVLFPGTVLPMQVTDPAQLALVADVLELDATIGVVLIDEHRPPRGEYPAVHEIGCAAHIMHAERLPNGRYNVLIAGLQRVRLLEQVPLERAYPCFRAELLPPPGEEALDRASRELGRLESCIMSLRSSIEDRDAQLCEVLRSTPDPVQLADVLAAAVIADAELQQRILAAAELSVRLRVLIDVLADVMLRTGSPPKQALMN